MRVAYARFSTVLVASSNYPPTITTNTIHKYKYKQKYTHKYKYKYTCKYKYKVFHSAGRL